MTDGVSSWGNKRGDINEPGPSSSFFLPGRRCAGAAAPGARRPQRANSSPFVVRAVRAVHRPSITVSASFLLRSYCIKPRPRRAASSPRARAVVLTSALGDIVPDGKINDFKLYISLTCFCDL